jgi:hypothetical protein
LRAHNQQEKAQGVAISKSPQNASKYNYIPEKSPRHLHGRTVQSSYQETTRTVASNKKKGTIVTKRQLLMAVWGEYKDDYVALQL